MIHQHHYVWRSHSAIHLIFVQCFRELKKMCPVSDFAELVDKPVVVGGGAGVSGGVTDLDHRRVNIDLHCFHKEDTPPEIYRIRFHEICSHYDGFHRLYTDGSKVGDQVASAAVTRNSTKVVRLANKASILRAELYAITKTLNLSSFQIHCQAWKPPMASKLKWIWSR